MKSYEKALEVLKAKYEAQARAVGISGGLER